MNDIEERIRAALTPYRLDEELMPKRRALRPPSPARRRRIVAIVAAVVAVGLVSLVLVAVLPVGTPGGPNPAVASLLHRFERIAHDAAPEAVPQAGQYVYTKTRSAASYVFVSGDGKYRFVFSVPVTAQMWLGLDGSGRQVAAWGDPTFATEADHAAYEAYIASGGEQADHWQFDWGKTWNEVYGPGELGWRDTSSLPTDPTELGRLIDERRIVGGPAGDWESFALATDLIRDSYARPDLRAALYSYMAGLSGIEMLGNTTDALGRPGVALASTHDGMRYEVVFDRSSGKILEERDVVLEPAQRVYENPGPGEYLYAYAGQSASVTTYVTFSDVVDSMTQAPSR